MLKLSRKLMNYLNRLAEVVVHIIINLILNSEKPKDRNQSHSAAKIPIILDIKTKNRKQDRQIFQEEIRYQEKIRITIQKNIDHFINKIALVYKKIQSMINDITTIMLTMM